MGNGYWNTTADTNAASARRKAGVDDFGYTSVMRGVPRGQRKPAPSLDAYRATVREARDSDEHPFSTPIAVLFDVTGSMLNVPQTLQRRLPDLLGLLTRGGYAQDPQILVGAIGDDVFDAVPLQIGQFESDNRIDEQLRDIYLEGGGGGDRKEGYALAAWFLATRAELDSLAKRARKGYCFIIGDEANKDVLSAASIRRFVGDELPGDLTIREVYRLLEERFHVYFVVPNLTSYYDEPWLEDHWRGVVGERFLKLEDPAAVCDLIAVTVGIMEESITLDEGLQDLHNIGSTGGAAVGKALANLGATGGGLATGGILPADL
jgi:hypothetical protein